MSLHRNRGAKRAREAREALGLDVAAPMSCLLECVERAGHTVVVTRMPEGIAGACTPGPLLWVNGDDAAVRQRFTLAHELGHAWLQHDGTLPVESYATLSGRVTTPHEIEANAFAAELLIPKAAVEQLAASNPTLEELVGVACEFGTSALMTLFRFKQFGLADDACIAGLQAAIDRQEHHGAFERLHCSPLADKLGTLDQLPYFSPPLHDSRLGAALRGDAAAEPALATAISRLLA